MKEIGIIRRIDELGRIVIPKEIRSVLKISSGEEMEIYIDNKTIILKKYSLLNNEKEEKNRVLSAVQSLTDGILLLTDYEKVLTSGEYENLKISLEIKNIINERKIYCSKEIETFFIENKILKGYFLFWPIIQNSNANGVIILIKSNIITKEDEVFMWVLKNIIENS